MNANYLNTFCRLDSKGALKPRCGFALSPALITALIGGLALAGCGGVDGNGANQPAAKSAQELRAGQKTSALNNSYATVVQELYISYFGRPADPNGLANFEADLAGANAPEDPQSLLQAYKLNSVVKQLIDSFGTSKESLSLYGSGTTRDFVTAIFTNVLNRQPLTSGLDFWVNAIDTGQITRGSASLSIMAGALTNTTPQGLLDAQLIQNRIAAATTFTTDIQTSAELRGYAGASAAQTARSLLAGVTATTNLSAYAVTIDSTVQSLSKYVVGGTLSGLAAGGNVTLLDNGGDALTLNANGTYQFATPLPNGASYNVTIGTLPIGQACAISSGQQQIIVGDVNFVNVACHLPYAYAIDLSGNTISQYSLLANGNLSIGSQATVATGKSPSSITVDPGHKNVYVTNQADNTVQQFSIGSGGGLSAAGTVATQYEPSAVAISPNGKYAYVANFGTTTVSQYTVGPTGGLIAQGTSTVTVGTGPSGIAIDPSSSYAYVLNNGNQTVSQFAIGAGGGLTPLAAAIGTGTNPLSIVATPNGKFVYVVNDSPSDHSVSQFGISSNGSLVALSPAKITVGTTPNAIVIDSAGNNAYIVDTAGIVWQYSIGSNGVLTQVGSVNVAQADAFAIDPSGRFAYVTSKGGTISQFTIGTSGNLTAMAPASVTAGQTPFGIVLSF
ncbi:MAG TPA: beta-propeller fold lactonase family protein [Burkholderiaceae bacterium]